MNYLFSERREKGEAAEKLIVCTNNSMKLITMMLISSCRNVNVKFHKISIFYNAIDRSNRGHRRREPSIRSVREKRLKF